MPTENILIIDPQLAGISGDMLLGALINLGADKNKIEKIIVNLPKYVKNCRTIEFEIATQTRCEIKSTAVKIKTNLSHFHVTGKKLKETLEKVLSTSNLSSKAKTYASNCLTTLLNAEVGIHSSTRDKVKLHETGSPDTLTDILGVATALDDLKIFENCKVYSLPVCVGKGKIKTVQGFFTVPAPATLEILTEKNFPFFGSNVNTELATPTGMALLTNIAEAITTYPTIKPSKIGYGAGSRDFKTFPNVLRILYGKSDISFISDEITILETNIDDITGETVGYIIEKLMKEGAKDAWAHLSIGKKGRPLITIAAIVSKEQKDHIANLIFKETGTLGLRILQCERMVLQRRIQTVTVNIAGKRFKVNVKVSKDPSGKIIQIKPEYEDVKKLASETGLPLRVLTEKIRNAYEEER